MKNSETKKNGKSGIITLIICGIIAMGLIVACVFFPDELFGLFGL